jgi:GTPase SAR1 family protein
MIVLVGTKSDLVSDMKYDDCVSYEEGINLSKKINAVGYFATSAKDHKNIDEVVTFSFQIFFGLFDKDKNESNTNKKYEKHCLIH